MTTPADRPDGRNKTKLMASGVGAGMFNYVIADHTSMGHDEKLSFGSFLLLLALFGFLVVLVLMYLLSRICNSFLDREAGSALKERGNGARSASYLELSERCKILPSTSVLLCRRIHELKAEEVGFRSCPPSIQNSRYDLRAMAEQNLLKAVATVEHNDSPARTLSRSS